MDFTLKTYRQLMETLVNNGYEFVTMEGFQPQQPDKKIVILRHDVDVKPGNSFETARIEHQLGITGTYYFRIVKQSFDKNIIRKIASLGHEIGYHYEDLALAKGDSIKAIQLFERHLDQFTDLYKVKTICMHGSPLSKYDNRLLWQHSSYSGYGIICEPYFDLDFSTILYLTDTGRRWDGGRVSVRDKEFRTNGTPLSHSFRFRSTHDIIKAANNGNLPQQLMINFHPQRWSDDPIVWSKELIWQRIKNQVKGIMVKQNENAKS